MCQNPHITMTQKVWNQKEAFGLTCWLIDVSLLASQFVLLSLEDWRKAHTLKAKQLATLQKLGTSESSNQTHLLFTKCHYLQKLLPTHTCLNLRGVYSWGDCIWQAWRKWECILDMASSHCKIVILVRQALCSLKMDILRTFDNSRLCAWLFRIWISPQGFY